MTDEITRSPPAPSQEETEAPSTGVPSLQAFLEGPINQVFRLPPESLRTILSSASSSFHAGPTDSAHDVREKAASLHSSRDPRSASLRGKQQWTRIIGLNNQDLIREALENPSAFADILRDILAYRLSLSPSIIATEDAITLSCIAIDWLASAIRTSDDTAHTGAQQEPSEPPSALPASAANNTSTTPVQATPAPPQDAFVAPATRAVHPSTPAVPATRAIPTNAPLASATRATVQVTPSVPATRAVPISTPPVQATRATLQVAPGAPATRAEALASMDRIPLPPRTPLRDVTNATPNVPSRSLATSAFSRLFADEELEPHLETLKGVPLAHFPKPALRIRNFVGPALLADMLSGANNVTQYVKMQPWTRITNTNSPSGSEYEACSLARTIDLRIAMAGSPYFFVTTDLAAEVDIRRLHAILEAESMIRQGWVRGAAWDKLNTMLEAAPTSTPNYKPLNDMLNSSYHVRQKEAHYLSLSGGKQNQSKSGKRGRDGPPGKDNSSNSGVKKPRRPKETEAEKASKN